MTAASLGQDPALVRGVYEMDTAFMGLGNATASEAGATIIHNPDALLVRDANQVDLTTHDATPAFDAVLAYTDTILADAPVRTVRTSPLTPPSLVAELVCAGFQRNEGLMLLLEDTLNATPPAHDIRRMETDADWDAWAVLDSLNWAETANKEQISFPPNLQPQYRTLKRARTDTIQYWLAYADGVPRAFLSSWAGANGIGMLEDLFTQAEYRHQGLATALIAHAVADIRARGVQRIAIPTDAHDTPKHMYTAMGFRPLSVHHTFWQAKS